MYLDCLIIGKKPIVDLRTPRINYMDQAKMSGLATDDLVKKGDEDPANWVFGKLPWKTQAEVVFFRVIERHVLTMPRASGLGSGGAPRFEFSRDVNTGAPPVDPGGSSTRVLQVVFLLRVSLMLPMLPFLGLMVFWKLFVGKWPVFRQLLSVLVASTGFFLPAMVSTLSLRRRFCQLKLEFLLSVVRALPTSGLALCCSRKCRMLVASLLKMKLVLLSVRFRGKMILFIWVMKEATRSVLKRLLMMVLGLMRMFNLKVQLSMCMNLLPRVIYLLMRFMTMILKMTMLVFLQRRLQTRLYQALAAPMGWIELNLSHPSMLGFLMLSRARQLKILFQRKIPSRLLLILVVLVQAQRSLLQQSHQLLLMLVPQLFLLQHNQQFLLFQILQLLQLLLVCLPTTLQCLLEMMMKRLKVIAWERRMIFPVLQLF